MAFLSARKGGWWSVSPHTRISSAVEETEAQTPAKAPNKLPNLPKDALILTSSDEATWKLECKEYKALAECESRRDSFAPLLESFELKGRYYHAFASEGTSLEDADFAQLLTKGGGDGAVPLPTGVQDAVRLALIKDLLEGVVWCHLRGAPHLAVDAKGLRLVQAPPLPGKRFGFWRLALVGIGAGPQLVTRTSPYQVSNESWAFNPPETLSGALIKGNLPGLYAWDAWSVGVALTMICGGTNKPPFAAEADIKDLTFSAQAAVAKKIERTFQAFSPFLADLNQQGGGFLFRHGWVVELVVGLLAQNPKERLSVVQAREIMTAALAERPGARGKANAKATASQGPRATAAAAYPGGKASAPPPKATALSRDETKALKAAFDQFDADKSGDIDAEEIAGALAAMGVVITDSQAEKLIEDADTDGNGKLDFVEFVLMTQDLVAGQLLDEDDGADKAAGVNALSDKLSAKAVFGRRLASAEGEPFRSLESMISIADKGLSEVVIERREDMADSRDPEAKALVNFKNYGEVVGFRNRADGDRWDVLVPGFEKQLAAGSRHRLSAVLGVILVKGGNHKLVVALGGDKPDPAAVKADIEDFVEAYAASHANVRSGKRIRYLELEDPFARPAGSLDVDSLPLGMEEDDLDGGGGEDKPKPPTAISNAF